MAQSLGIGHITHQLAIGKAIDADINHHRTGGNPIPPHHFCPASRRHQDFRPAAFRRQIPRAGMRNRHRAISPQKQLRHGPPDNLRTPQHQGPRTTQRNAGFRQQMHHPARRTRNQARLARRQPPGIQRVKAIHILARVHRGNRGFCPDMGGQGKLHQNPIHGRVSIQPRDFREQISFGGRLRQMNGGAIEAGLGRRAVLVAHINATRGVFTHAHHAQAGLEGKGGYARGKASPQPGAKRLAIKNPCGHAKYSILGMGSAVAPGMPSVFSCAVAPSSTKAIAK